MKYYIVKITDLIELHSVYNTELELLNNSKFSIKFKPYLNSLGYNKFLYKKKSYILLNDSHIKYVKDITFYSYLFDVIKKGMLKMKLDLICK